MMAGDGTAEQLKHCTFKPISNIVGESIKKHLASFNFSGDTGLEDVINEISNMLRVGHKYKKSGLKHVLAKDLDSLLLTRQVETI